MSEFQLPDVAQQWANDVLVWIGFGTLAGLLAKAILPGRDPGGALVTLMMGITGTVIGSGVLMYISDLGRVTPISPLGFLAATLGATIILVFYRLLSGRVGLDGEHPYQRPPARRRRTTRRYSDAPLSHYDEL